MNLHSLRALVSVFQRPSGHPPVHLYIVPKQPRRHGLSIAFHLRPGPLLCNTKIILYGFYPLSSQPQRNPLKKILPLNIFRNCSLLSTWQPVACIGIILQGQIHSFLSGFSAAQDHPHQCILYTTRVFLSSVKPEQATPLFEI